nr:hypothetical protein [Halosimplex litoreum]
MSIFPLRSEPDVDDREPKLVDLAEADAEAVFDALGSETARSPLLELHEEPRPASNSPRRSTRRSRTSSTT